MGGFMKINGFGVGRDVILGASLLAFAVPWWSASGQTPDTQAATTTATAQAPRVPARVTQTVDEENRLMLRGNVHPMARAEFDRGAVAESQPASRMALLLQRGPEQETALRQLLDQQQDKSSPSYHKWLTPDQFGQQYGPADQDIQAVTDWLTSRGFTGIKVGAGRTIIEFSGNVGQVRSAFQTDIHHFLVNGQMHISNVSNPQIPAALAPVVAGVLSLHDFRPKAQTHRLGTFRKIKATGEVKPLFTFAGCGTSNAPVPCYAVGPGDFQKIYNVPYTPTTIDGTGVTIAIVQDSNLNVADVQQFRSLFGLPANFNTDNIVLNGPDPGIQGPDSVTGDEIEADLDVQWAGAVAPGATVKLVVSQDSESIGTFGIDLSAIYIIDNNIAPIMSESFGACEAGLTTAGEQFYIKMWQQASAQGITVILSSGDSGSAACDPAATPANQDVATQGLNVSGLASTAYNVAVGGTDFQNGVVPSPFWNTTNAATTQTSAKSYIPESTWNDTCAAAAIAGNLSLATCTAATVNANNDPNASKFGIDLVAAGGGPSSFTTLNPKPLWQMGTTGNPADGVRDVPDISFFAGNGFNGSFYVVCQQDANSGTGSSTSSCDLNSPFNDFQGVGGTSAGAPAFAGVMALVIQKQALQRQGNANPILYQLYKNNAAGTICKSNSAAVTATACIFYDTVTGNNSVACLGGSTNCSNTSTAANQFGITVDPAHTTNPAWVTTPGYDLATGLGSLNVTNLVNKWGLVSLTGNTVAITSPATGTVSITHGSPVSFTVKVTPTTPTTPAPAGSVSLVATPASGTPPTTTGNPQSGIGSFAQDTLTVLDTSGTANISTNQLPGGTAYPVVAGYSGDGKFAAGTSAPITVTVTPEASNTAVNVVTFDAQNNPVINAGAISLPYGSPYILQIAVSDSTKQQCAAVVVACPTGTVTLKDGTSPVNDFSGQSIVKLNSQAIAEDQPVQLGVGAHSLTAAYSGDNSFTASTSPADAVTITTAPTTTTAASGAASVPIGQPLTITATIATQSSGVAPTGTVTFKAGTTTIGTATVAGTAAVLTGTFVPAGGTASASVSFTAAGTQSVTTVYSGDTNYAGSTSAAITVTATAGTQVTTTVVTPSVTTVASGGSVTLTAKVTGTSNNVAGPTGTVQFKNGTTPLGAAATCTPTPGTASTPGTCTATLTTTLALLTPGFGPANGIRNMPIAPMWIVGGLMLALLLLGLARMRVAPLTRRLGYACAGALLLACLAAGIAGCGGGGGGGGGGGTTPHTDSVTAVYGGDGTYAGSTSAAVTISVQ
jgi:Pro-kumamolisin, activation domain/Bacterial Ig-like domain (group 3)